MIKKIIFIAGIVSLLFLTGCNMRIFDTKYTFKYADIENVGTVEVYKWNDFDDSDTVQITDTNGVTYLTHYSNVILRDR